MTWGSPFAFLLFIPWLIAGWRLLRVGRRRGIPFAPLARLPRTASWRQRLAILPPLLLLAGLAAAIVAAARPQRSLGKARRTTEAIAINMVLDISGSMNALDLSLRKGTGWDYKTRLDVVKETFEEFVGRRPDDLIGLITFGGFAVTRSPLTLNHDALRHYLAEVQIPRSDQGGVDSEELMTAIGDGLAMACARLQQASNVVSRIAVLLSDGDSNAGIITPEEATRLAKQMGIKVYTIGVGSTGNAPALFYDSRGRQVIRQAYVSMDERELKRIAAETGGLYFGVRDRAGLEKALTHIDELEKTTISEVSYDNRIEHFGGWLWTGAALVCSAVILGMLIEPIHF